MSQSSKPNNSTDVVLQLRSVTRRIEVFFEHQMQRLRTAMQQMEEMQAEYDAARRLAADIESQREQWHRERDLESERLTKASEAMARGWHELEQAQRNHLIETNASSRTPEQSSWNENPGTTQGTSEKPADEQSDQVAIDLFEMQQLQSQVQQHMKRSR